MPVLEFESTFFVASSVNEKMRFAENNFYIIPYNAVKSIVDNGYTMDIKLYNDINSKVSYNKTIFLINEGEEFDIKFNDNFEKQTFIDNFNRYKKLNKN